MDCSANDGGSFPSGHMIGVVVCLGLARLIARPRAGRWIWLIPAFGGGLMGASPVARRRRTGRQTLSAVRLLATGVLAVAPHPWQRWLQMAQDDVKNRTRGAGMGTASSLTAVGPMGHTARLDNERPNSAVSDCYDPGRGKSEILRGAMRIAIFGLGYVGTVTAAGLASQGHQVCGVDVDALKVEHIRSGRSPVVEPGIEELIATAVESGDLTATTDPVAALERADVSLLCVGTPSKSQGGTDLTYLRRALDDIRQGLEVATPPASGFHAVVVRSTVPPGTGDEVVRTAFSDVPPRAGP